MRQWNKGPGPIEHVAVLLLENRSFDHMLGCLQQVYPHLDGIDPNAPPRTNSDGAQPYSQVAGAARIIKPDPRHEHSHVVTQLGNGNGGFVRDYALAYPHSDPAARAEIMKFHDLDTLPALHALARNFTICDHWFASVPGPTWTNRLFALSGTSLGRVEMPEGLFNLNLHWYSQTTLFDRLNERSIPWRVYFGDFPLSLLFVNQWQPKNVACYRPMPEFDEAASGPPEDFPAFSLIEPSYLDPSANDDHPPHDVLAGQALIARVYNALRANEALWNTTLLIVLYDEHGGLYDHVSPPAAVPPDHHQDEYTFDQLGVRVPTLLVSPWVGAGVLQTEFDHTSMLKFATEQWGLGPLGARVAAAQSFRTAFLPALRATPASIPAGPLAAAAVSRPELQLSGHQSAIVAFSHALESMAGEDASIIAGRNRAVLSGAQSQIDGVMDRVEAFVAARTRPLLSQSPNLSKL